MEPGAGWNHGGDQALNNKPSTAKDAKETKLNHKATCRSHPELTKSEVILFSLYVLSALCGKAPNVYGQIVLRVAPLRPTSTCYSFPRLE